MEYPVNVALRQPEAKEFCQVNRSTAESVEPQPRLRSAEEPCVRLGQGAVSNELPRSDGLRIDSSAGIMATGANNAIAMVERQLLLHALAMAR